MLQNARDLTGGILHHDIDRRAVVDYVEMPSAATHVVVDGSNLATEGRSTPSLAQLDEAVREFMHEYPDAKVTVVVDGTFGYRIDESERRAFEEAEEAGEIVSPPAGAIGRGDAFVLRIADKVGALVLSNDSFQEFHGEHEWLFEKGRLIGGKPVPGVGWIFTPRAPVRGPRSRQAVRTAKREAAVPDPPPPKKAPAKPRREKAVEKAIQVAVEEAVEPDSKGKRRRRRSSASPTEPVNEPLAFITFVAEHPPGTEVEGEVESFSSHGAFITVGLARCYLPLAAISDPPPRSARSVLSKGERRKFVVRAFDAPRRGIELGLVAEEPVADLRDAPTPPTKRIRATKSTKEPAKKTAAKRATVKKAAATTKKAAAKKAAAKKAAAKAPPAKKAAKKKTAAKKTAKKKAATPAG